MKTEEELLVRRTILIGSFSWSIGGQTHRSRHHQQDFPSLIYNNWSNHILTSFVIYYCEDAQQHGIYLLISSSCEEAERLSWIWTFSLVPVWYECIHTLYLWSAVLVLKQLGVWYSIWYVWSIARPLFWFRDFGCNVNDLLRMTSNHNKHSVWGSTLDIRGGS